MNLDGQHAAGEAVASPGGISIDVCTTLDEMHECVELQRSIWNGAEEDLIPTTLFVVAKKIGGQVLRARDGTRPVGFALAFPAFRGESRYFHSHILGIAPEYQNRGLGRRMKMKQRELALGVQVQVMEWTFDPLAIRNAYFNLVRLGAVIRRFHPNLYGVTSSPLHGGLPTDRVVAEWRMSSKRVENALAGRAPVVARNAVEVVIPGEIEEWKRSELGRAAELQERLRAEFEARFAQGLIVTGLRMEGRSGIYLLEPEESDRDLTS